MKLAKILVAIDGSDSSVKAAECAIDLARTHHSELVALNVVVSELGYGYSSGVFGLVTPSSINELLEGSRQEAEGWFREIGNKASKYGIAFSTEVVASPTSVVPAIVDYAEKNNVDLVVIGTRGRSGFRKLVLGSVASGVVTYSKCPVMVIK